MTRERLKTLAREYGRIAIFTYLAIFVVVLSGFALAIWLGVDVHTTAASAGVLGAAYLATKLTQPVRILATVSLTPLVAAGLRRLGLAKPSTSEPPIP